MRRDAARARRARPQEPANGLTVSAPTDTHEREADRIADAVVDTPATNVMPFAPRPGGVQRMAAGAGGPGPRALDLNSSGSPLASGARGFLEPRFGASLSGVRVHTGTEAEQAATQLDARAFTLGSDIYFGAGEYAPGSEGGMRLLAHEVTHTLQPQAAGRISRKTLADIPEATRKKLSVSRNTPVATEVPKWVTNYFDPASGMSGSPAADVEFGNEISDAKIQKGFKGIANELESLTTVLPVGSIIDLAIDLRPFGEHGIFRFTHYEDTAAKKTKILVERTTLLAPAPTAQSSGSGQGATGGPGPTTQPQPQSTNAPGGQAQAPVFTGSQTIGSIKVEIGAGFTNDRAKVIVDAIGLMPATIQAKVNGVQFHYAGSGKGPDGQAAHYDTLKDTVEVWSDLYDASPRRVGTSDTPSYSLIHELGHAIDLRPLFAAQLARDKARAEKKKLEDELKNPKVESNDPLEGIGGQKSDKRLAEEKRLKDAIAAADKEIAAQNTAMKTAKSIAGDELGDATDSEQLLTDYGKALTADGITAVKDARKTNRKTDADNAAAKKFNEENPDKPPKDENKPHISTLKGNVSDYADTDLMESFAESFSLYILDEALLLAIRPNVHAFFVKALPKTAPPPTTGTTKP